MKKILQLAFFLTSMLINAQVSGEREEFIISEIPNNGLGNTVSLSNNGKILAAGSRSGVLVYENIDGIWVQLGNAIPMTTSRFSLSGNGNTLSTLQLLDDNEVSVHRIFENINGEWIAIGNDIEGTFTSAGSLSNDGRLLVLRDNPISIYKIQDGIWTLMESDFGDKAGRRFEVSNDGNIISFINGIGIDTVVSVFENIDGIWVQLGEDFSPSPQLSVASRGGLNTTLSGDGLTFAFSTPMPLFNQIEDGPLQIFRFQNDSWVQIGPIIRESVGIDNEIGRSISLSNDGNLLAVGAPGAARTGPNMDAGAILVFQFENNDWNVIRFEFGRVLGGRLGDSISISADGRTVAAGVPTTPPGGSVTIYNIEEDIVLSLEDNNLNVQAFKIFPNPTKENLQVSSPEVEIEKISIFNAQGALIMEEKTEESSANIDVSDLSTGNYFVKVITKNGKEINKQFIKE